MRLDSNRYTIMFALIICVICSFSISLVSEGLRERKELNVALDIKKNILKAVDLQTPLVAKASAEDVFQTYTDKIVELVINADGDVVEGLTPDKIKEGEEFFPLYEYREGAQVMAYCYPVQGKGLWSTLYGYLAIEPDAMTVRGMTFYKHGETPGLGAEIEKDWFLNNFKGKKIWDVRASKLVPVAVVKGQVATVVPADQADYFVDGISGATMTSKGVTALIDKWVNAYEPFFKKIRRAQNVN